MIKNEASARFPRSAQRAGGGPSYNGRSCYRPGTSRVTKPRARATGPQSRNLTLSRTERTGVRAIVDVPVSAVEWWIASELDLPVVSYKRWSGTDRHLAVR